MVYVNDFCGQSDSEIIQKAIEGRGKDGIVVIEPRKSTIQPERDFWLLDHAMLLPSDTTILMRNCKLKLSDQCRDNFFRSANCGMGQGEPAELKNIYIKGEGFAILEGADHPRATGDAGKMLHTVCPHDEADILAFADWISEEERQSGKVEFFSIHNHSYGTDAGKEGENQKGDWRGIGILFANVSNFSIENITIKESHGWGISLEACRNGRVEKIHFDARMYKYIDGLKSNMENQDGIDVRNGCSDIIISDITGCTGDDVIALTAIAKSNGYQGGGFATHVMHSDWTRREKGIRNVIIRNVVARSYLCWIVRLLAAGEGVTIENVVVDGIIDTSADENIGGIIIGDTDGYAKIYNDSIKNVCISNVISKREKTIWVQGYLSDSVITNIVNNCPNGQVVCTERENALNNVKIL